jgi:hypothetical protein
MRASLTTTQRKHNASSLRPFPVSCRAKSRHLPILRDLIRSLPVRSASGLPIYVAASRGRSILDCVPLRSTSLGITDGNCAKICPAFDCVYFVVGKPTAFQALKPPAMDRTFL